MRHLRKASIIVLYTLNRFLKVGGRQKWYMLEVKREHSQLLKQAKPLTALVALKNTQHRREGRVCYRGNQLGFLKWVSQLCIIFKNKMHL